MKPTDQASLIDTSNMSEGQRAALEMAESSRDQRAVSGYAASLFTGNPNFRKLSPFPEQSEQDRRAGDAFLGQLQHFLSEHTDPDQIDADGEIPDEVIAGLAKIGAFGIKIPTEYGGLGLSQSNYSRAAMLLGAHCGNLTALLSAHQSIGVPQPLIVFGTEEQKRRYLPDCASGAISAFALTEKEVGSDPARMKTTATPSPDGQHFILSGEKVWCTNGLKAKYLIVMAKTPTADHPQATTAFIVPSDSPGVEVLHRCHFMGLRALYNGVIRFNAVQVPRENIVHAEGRGLKVALSTLNTGRITLPAACAGMMERLLRQSLRWARRREQWGCPIGQHAAIAAKLADLAADQFATESMVLHVSALVDADKKADIRLEAAMAKLWGTEAGWRSVTEAMQIKGGRGYETAPSLRARGERPDAIERFLRDARINTIFEGSSEIMRLFIAREALDPHLRRGAKALDTRQGMGTRTIAAGKAGLFYAAWLPLRYLPMPVAMPDRLLPGLRDDVKRISRLSQQLARRLFVSMAQYGPKLEKQQLLLGRYVDIACELYATATSIARTQQMLATGDPKGRRALGITQYLVKRSEFRIQQAFKANRRAPDASAYRLAQSLLAS